MSARSLSVTDAAELLHFKPKTIRAWCAKGVFPNARKYPDDKPRSEWRIPETDIHELEAQRRERPPSALDPKRREALLLGL
ncbi:helix-turn-helix domain-containing protein [Nesterenkonia lacusekhoensis]|uniref:Site-specific integrase-resolvase n=1 Tax=Nesterenkonia lacusekhoensis TaxID=150832 RepID=A0ABS4SYT6_9MICC|nr:putative site-specific integrase-resolvase [Nesterenkonia lacusekhoensis]